MSLIPDSRLEDLTPEDLGRYSRHLLLSEVGLIGQQRLKAAKVLIVGTGGLGAPLALYLAAAGVGTLGLVDFDVVESSNLQRQIIHSSRDIDRPKVASAADRLKALNPSLKLQTYNIRLNSSNALQIIKEYDVVADGTDNFPTRYLVGDACVLAGKPNVYASILRFEGQASVFDAAKGPCYRCLYPSPPPPGLVPSCGEGGVMGVLPGILGSIQAAEVIKIIVGGARPLIGRLLLFDAWQMTFSELEIEKDPACPICGQNPTIKELVDYDDFCGLKAEPEEIIESLTVKELKVKLDAGTPIEIIDIREPHERTMFRFDGTKPIPFGQLVRRMEEFDQDRDLVVICKIGQRSLFAIRTLKQAGYHGPIFNLAGGVNAWAKEFDPTMVVY
ncbi:MAG: molybdopterin-synthase adenylyltransferase MoeB [Deltaproteobacteria bacterium]|jgi:adenylyltransferase/sulfurtransferase|nr:molybdopterin-synthase adenylyltransferase MoeB [Deltaproteobacteria bacterium]